MGRRLRDQNRPDAACSSSLRKNCIIRRKYSQVARKGKRSFPMCKKPRRSMCVHLNGQWLVRPLSLHGRTRRLPRWHQHSPPGDFCRETFLRANASERFLRSLHDTIFIPISKSLDIAGEIRRRGFRLRKHSPAFSCKLLIYSLSFVRWCPSWKRRRDRSMSRFHGETQSFSLTSFYESSLFMSSWGVDRFAQSFKRWLVNGGNACSADLRHFSD